MRQTENLNLKLIDGTDNVDEGVLNYNTEAIDSNLGTLNEIPFYNALRYTLATAEQYSHTVQFEDAEVNVSATSKSGSSTNISFSASGIELKDGNAPSANGSIYGIGSDTDPTLSNINNFLKSRDYADLGSSYYAYLAYNDFIVFDLKTQYSGKIHVRIRGGSPTQVVDIQTSNDSADLSFTTIQQTSGYDDYEISFSNARYIRVINKDSSHNAYLSWFYITVDGNYSVDDVNFAIYDNQNQLENGIINIRVPDYDQTAHEYNFYLNWAPISNTYFAPGENVTLVRHKSFNSYTDEYDYYYSRDDELLRVKLDEATLGVDISYLTYELYKTYECIVIFPTDGTYEVSKLNYSDNTLAFCGNSNTVYHDGVSTATAKSNIVKFTFMPFEGPFGATKVLITTQHSLSPYSIKIVADWEDSMDKMLYMGSISTAFPAGTKIIIKPVQRGGNVGEYS